jgi:hypothetical protein
MGTALAGLRKQGVPVVYGDAARPGVLEHAGLQDARLLVVTAPDPFQARAVIDLARRIHPGIDIVLRTHSEAEREYLESRNVGKAVMGESELADAMATPCPRTVRGFRRGVSPPPTGGRVPSSLKPASGSREAGRSVAAAGARPACIDGQKDQIEFRYKSPVKGQGGGDRVREEVSRGR